VLGIDSPYQPEKILEKNIEKYKQIIIEFLVQYCKSINKNFGLKMQENKISSTWKKQLPKILRVQ
jgi:hypothetical protein